MASTISQGSPQPMPPHSANWPVDGYPPNGGMDQNAEFASFADLTGFGAVHSADTGPVNGASRGMQSPYKHPMLPTDLFSLPMSLDWDWAEMSGGAYPTVENGNFEMR